MEEIGILLSLLTEVAKIVNFKNATKYKDQMMDLERQYAQELAKGDQRDDANVYSIRFELRNLAKIYSAELKGSPAQNQSGSSGH